MVDKIHYMICVLVALIVTVVCIIQQTGLFLMASRLTFSIILFYFLGLILRSYLKKKVFFKKTSETLAVAEAQAEDAAPAEEREGYIQ